jgi:hypothetical protein
VQNATVQKLHASYCDKHSITNPDDVVMSLQDRVLRFDEHLKFYGLVDHDEISVKINNSVASAPKAQTIEVQLRFPVGDPETHRIIPVRFFTACDEAELSMRVQ